MIVQLIKKKWAKFQKKYYRMKDLLRLAIKLIKFMKSLNLIRKKCLERKNNEIKYNCII